MTTDLIEEIQDGVATLTMNRPESLNALSGGMMQAMLDALLRYSVDPDVRVIVLTGAGRGFCAGGDVKGMAANNSAKAGKNRPASIETKTNGLRASMEISKLLHECPKPTIAKVRGPAAGAGLSLALACDIRIASTTAKLTTAFAKVAASGDFGGSYFLPKLVGSAKARELYFTSAKLTADEAFTLGMVNHVYPDDELDNAVAEMAANIASGPALAHEYMKKNLNAAESGSLDQVFDMEAAHMVRTMMTEDHKEAAMAFVEKRAPNFKGE